MITIQMMEPQVKNNYNQIMNMKLTEKFFLKEYMVSKIQFAIH